MRRKFKSCSSCSLRADTIFSGLDSSGVLELEGMLQRSVYPAGVVLYLKGEKPRGIYCICSGRVKLSAHSLDGKGLVVGYPSAGSVIGIREVLSGEPHDFTARTVEESELGFMEKEQFLGFLRKNGGICLRLAECLGEELSRAYADLRNVTLAKPEERLASLLLRLCDDFGEPAPEGIAIKLGVSQEEMAEMAGMSRRTLTRALGTLKKMELIKSGRRITIVRDKTALQDLLS